MAATEIEQERYIFGNYGGLDFDLIYHEIKDSIVPWLENLDKTIHVPFRLSILSILYQNRIISFTILKHLLRATSGNLNNHLYTLERAKLVEIQKVISRSRPITLITITEEGQRRFERYVSAFCSTFENDET